MPMGRSLPVPRTGVLGPYGGSLPVKDVVCRKVAMNATMRQRQFDVVEDAVEQRLRLLLLQHNIAEAGSGFINVTNVLHQDRVASLGERPGHIGSVRVKQALRQVFVLDPGCHLGCPSSLGFACGTAAPAAVA